MKIFQVILCFLAPILLISGGWLSAWLASKETSASPTGSTPGTSTWLGGASTGEPCCDNGTSFLDSSSSSSDDSSSSSNFGDASLSATSTSDDLFADSPARGLYDPTSIYYQMEHPDSLARGMWDATSVYYPMEHSGCISCGNSICTCSSSISCFEDNSSTSCFSDDHLTTSCFDDDNFHHSSTSCFDE